MHVCYADYISALLQKKRAAEFSSGKFPLTAFHVSVALLQLYIKANNQCSNKEEVRCVLRAFGLELRRQR